MPQKLRKIKIPQRLKGVRRIVWVACLIVLILLSAGFTYWTYFRKQIVREQLELAILDGSDSLYQIQYSQMKMDEVKGWILVRNLVVQYDSNRLNTLLQNSTAPASVLRIKIPEIRINGVKTPRVLLGKELIAHEIEIIRPVVEIFKTSQSDTTGTQSLSSATEYDKILGNLNKIGLGRLIVDKANIISTRLNAKDTTLHISDLHFDIKDITIDSNSSLDPNRILFANKVKFACRSFEWPSQNKIYSYKADSVKYDSEKLSLHVGRYQIIPQLSEAAFTKQLRFANDRFDLELQKIHVFGLNLPALQRDSVLIDSLKIDGGHLWVYRDLAVPHDGKSRLGTYPHQLLAKAGLAINIPVFRANGFDIEYRERNVKTRKTGAVKFGNSRIKITDISNFTTVPATQPMDIRVSSSFMNQSPLQVSWKLFPASKNGRFEINGDLGALQPATVNQLMEPMASARMENGTVNGLTFRISGNDYGSSSWVKLLYNGLKISILEKEEDGKLNKKGLVSFAANLAIKNSNPAKKDADPRVVQSKTTRDTRRSIFHLSWKSLLDGIKESVMKKI